MIQENLLIYARYADGKPLVSGSRDAGSIGTVHITTAVHPRPPPRPGRGCGRTDSRRVGVCSDQRRWRPI